MYFVPSLILIPAFQDELDRLFPDKDTVFHHLARYLFHPINDVWYSVTRCFWSYLAKAEKGWKFRSGYMKPKISQKKRFIPKHSELDHQYNIGITVIFCRIKPLGSQTPLTSGDASFLNLTALSTQGSSIEL